MLKSCVECGTPLRGRFCHECGAQFKKNYPERHVLEMHTSVPTLDFKRVAVTGVAITIGISLFVVPALGAMAALTMVAMLLRISRNEDLSQS